MRHSHPTIRQQNKKVTRYDTPRPHIEPVVEIIIEPVIEQEQVEKVPRKPKPKPIIRKPPTLPLDITAIVVNFKTKKLIKQAVQTFRQVYPSVPLIIIDNASKDNSTEWIKSRICPITTIINETNIGHGPALHQGMMLCETKYVFTFDSDIKFNRGGFLERMQQNIENNYAVGWLRWVGKNGVSVRGNPNKTKHCPYIHPCFALFNLEIYRTLKHFVNKGAPLIDNMRDARKQKYSVVDFQFERYAEHLVAGTRRLYRGHWFGRDKEPEQKWNPNAKIPI